MPPTQHSIRLIYSGPHWFQSQPTHRPAAPSVLQCDYSHYTHYTNYTFYTPFSKVFLNLAFRGYFPKTPKKGVRCIQKCNYFFPFPFPFFFLYSGAAFFKASPYLIPCFLAYALTNEIHSLIVVIHCVEIITQYFLFRADLRGGLGVFGAAVVRDTACFFSVQTVQPQWSLKLHAPRPASFSVRVVDWDSGRLWLLWAWPAFWRGTRE